MNNILMLNTIKDYNDFMQVETVHPQVSVINMSDIPPLRHARKNMGFYTIFLKEIKCADSLQYGRRQYDYQENTLIFIGPGQIIGNNDNGETFQPKGWCLTFHPELLHGTSLGRRIQEYTFFTYAINEALHISKQERETLIDCMMKINEEIKGGTDKHSNQIIVSTIELFLNYCVRFYDRQFATRINESKDILHSFETLLNGYFVSEKPQSFGTPTVAYCADQLHLSDQKRDRTFGTGIHFIENDGGGEKLTCRTFQIHQRHSLHFRLSVSPIFQQSVQTGGRIFSE